MEGFGETVEVDKLVKNLGQEDLARKIANQWMEWKSARAIQEEEWRNIRDYVFATDTSTTLNAKLPWKNHTVTPKLCQIRDNLYSNYIASLFPNNLWLDYEAGDPDSARLVVRNKIKAYMLQKCKDSGFEDTVSKLLLDWIDTGNCFAQTIYENRQETLPDGSVVTAYSGPKVIRINPADIVFNPLVNSFENSPKIVRRVMTLGDLAAAAENTPDGSYLKEALDIASKNRVIMQEYIGMDNQSVAQGLANEGFGDYIEYLTGDVVELLDFYGNLYDAETKELKRNVIVTVVDRCKVVRNEPNPSWLGTVPIRHCPWRVRQDNLYGMSPLANLIGLQYRIDHLENLKADVFDLVAFPLLKIKGNVEEFTYTPGATIFCGDEGDVQFLSPDAQALNADMQINLLENRMEELAGAPKEAMGIRTPGEKTAFEVQKLDNAASRIFQNKINYFERNLLEPILNDMLEVAKRNLDTYDIVRTVEPETNVVLFQEVNKELLSGQGKMVAQGARHFAEKNNLLQNLTQAANTALMQDPDVKVHFSPFKTAKLLEDLLDLDAYNLVHKNIRIVEEAETQDMAEDIQEQQYVNRETQINPEQAMVNMIEGSMLEGEAAIEGQMETPNG